MIKTVQRIFKIEAIAKKLSEEMKNLSNFFYILNQFVLHFLVLQPLKFSSATLFGRFGHKVYLEF